MLVTGFYKHEPSIHEDGNVASYDSVGMLAVDLKRRARCVLGLRGINHAETMSLDGNAVQHAMRMIAGNHEGSIQVIEWVMAEYATHIANETHYWESPRLSSDIHWE
jgi:hypothetical protein